MAIAFRSSSSGDLAGPGGTTTLGLPAGVQPTDIVIAVFGSTRNAVVNPNVVSPPAGWSSIAAGLSGDDGTNEVTIAGFWALGSVAALGFTNPQTSGLKQGWVASAYSGVDNVTPIDAMAAASAGTGGGGLTTNSVTIVTAGAWHLICLVDLDSQEMTSPAPFLRAANGAPPSHASALLIYNPTPLSPGATGTVASGISVSDPTDVLLGLPFALRPAVIPPLPPRLVMVAGLNRAPELFEM